MNVVVYHNWKEIFLLMLRFRNRFSIVNCDVLRLSFVPKIEYLYLHINTSSATSLTRRGSTTTELEDFLYIFNLK